MTLDPWLSDLLDRLAELQSAIAVLETTVVEDRPRHQDVIVASRFEDETLTARGYVEEACSTVIEARRAIETRFDAAIARKALAACQMDLNRFSSVLHGELASYERLDDLTRAARERGKTWVDWVAVVREETEVCRQVSERVNELLLACWQGLVEQLSSGAVMIHNYSVGQQFADHRIGSGPAHAQGKA